MSEWRNTKTQHNLKEKLEFHGQNKTFHIRAKQPQFRKATNLNKTTKSGA